MWLALGALAGAPLLWRNIVVRQSLVLLGLSAMLCLTLPIWTPFLHAHDPGLSSLEVQIQRDCLVATFTFAPSDLGIQSVGSATQSPALRRRAGSALAVSYDGVRVSPERSDVKIDDQNNAFIILSFPTKPATRLTLRSEFLKDAAPGHRQYLAIRDRRGNFLAEKMLNASSEDIVVDLAAETFQPSSLTKFREFLALGIEHILTGYDHLLFLIGLLLGGISLLSAAKIITSFTVAHSITLGLAALGVVRLPSELVEPLIAASILYVGLDNLFGKNRDRRWLLTFAFGLVHGFGFATALGDIGIGSAAVLSLLAFNLGVELGQLAIAGLALPLLRYSSQRPMFAKRIVPAFSILIALAGSYWLFERLAGF